MRIHVCMYIYIYIYIQRPETALERSAQIAPSTVTINVTTVTINVTIVTIITIIAITTIIIIRRKRAGPVRRARRQGLTDVRHVQFGVSDRTCE